MPCTLLTLTHLTAAFSDTNVIVRDLSGNVQHEFPALSALFGSEILDGGLQGNLVYASPVDACGPVKQAPQHVGNNTQWIALVRRNVCSFVQKVQHVQRAGFSAAIIHNVGSNSLLRMHAAASSVTAVPSVFVGAGSAEILSTYNYSTDYTVELKPVDPGYKFLWPFVAVLVMCMCVMLMISFLKYACGKVHMCIKRVSKSSLRKLPVKKFSKGDKYDICAICLEEYQIGDKLRIMPCSHAFHRKCIDVWLTKTKHTCPLCKKKVFCHGSMADDSDSDSGSVENSGTSASERTPLLASVTVSEVATASAQGMPASVTSTTIDSVHVASTGVTAERHWGPSSIEIHHAEFHHDASSPDQHATGSALPMDASEPSTAEPTASSNVTTSFHMSLSENVSA